MDKEFSVADLLGITEEELEVLAPANPKPSAFPLTLKAFRDKHGLSSTNDNEDSESDETEYVSSSSAAEEALTKAKLTHEGDAEQEPVSGDEILAKPQVIKPPILGVKL